MTIVSYPWLCPCPWWWWWSSLCLHINTGTWEWCITWSLTLPRNVLRTCPIPRVPVIIKEAFSSSATRITSTLGLPWTCLIFPCSWKKRPEYESSSDAYVISWHAYRAKGIYNYILHLFYVIVANPCPQILSLLIVIDVTYSFCIWHIIWINGV